MGLNLNLCEMFDLPKKVKCPKCKLPVKTHLNDFDIECEEIEHGTLNNHGYCHACEYEWTMVIKFKAKIKRLLE